MKGKMAVFALSLISKAEVTFAAQTYVNQYE